MSKDAVKRGRHASHVVDQLLRVAPEIWENMVNWTGAFSASEVDEIKGLKPDAIQAKHPELLSSVVIHRDNLVLLD